MRLSINSFYIFGLLFFTFGFGTVAAQCNGHADLCNRRYDEVAYLTTHNAFCAAQDNFLFPNQNFGLTQQLQDGVRGMMLDVYDENGTITVYHGTPLAGSAPFSSNLAEIKNFLDANPNEIVTLIIQCGITANDMESELTAAGLMSRVYTKPTGGQWATLQQMIDDDERIVILSDCNDAGPTQAWYHYIWDHAFETDWDNNDTTDFSCAVNRGDSAHSLFVLNHFNTTPVIGTGDPQRAAIANANPYFFNRAMKCQIANNRLPNFPTVDFYEIGDGMEVVDMLNGVFVGAAEAHQNENGGLSIWPQPVANGQILHVRFETPVNGPLNITIYSLLGESLHQASGLTGQEITLPIPPLSAGIYLLEVQTSD
ncbi:MAG: phosphatidylinositol-specific phospholipase C domain-containing protein, partial [Bacteroidota bacterium]